VYSHHHNERITKQMGTQGALQVLGALAGARYGQGAADAVVQGGGIAAQAGFLLPSSREQESEADVVGQQLMARAGFDPRQAVNLWQNMIAASGSRPPQWLSTHPNPESRIQELGNRAASLVPVYEQARATGHTPKCG
jgi:predicted Zn-dependent protease